MKSPQIPMLPAKNFVFPVLRPLLTMIKCLKAMAQFSEQATPPVVLRRECLSNAGYLASALGELCARADIAKSEYAPIMETLSDPGLWTKHPVNIEIFNGLLKGLEKFCQQHKKDLGAAYRQDKTFFQKLYRQSVLKRKVLIIHASDDSPEVLKETLSSGAYYDVETQLISHARDAGGALEKSVNHHITLFLCTSSKDAVEFLVRSSSDCVDLFLSDLGREVPVLNMNLCRLVNQAQNAGMKFMSSPYVAMKLLPAIEAAFVDRLAAFDKAIADQEGAMAAEEDALIQGMDEAVLFAELIVESAWKKTAGFTMEQSVMETGN